MVISAKRIQVFQPGGGKIICLNESVQNEVFYDECESNPQKPKSQLKVLEKYCASNKPCDCADDKLEVEEKNCPYGYRCIELNAMPAFCSVILYNTCQRYEPNPDPMNPSAGFVLLTLAANDTVSIFDNCLSEDEILEMHCPPAGASITIESVNNSSVVKPCGHCKSLEEKDESGNAKYPSIGYCGM